jgi:hypothetical protein
VVLTAIVLALCILSHNFLGPLTLGLALVYATMLAVGSRRRADLAGAGVAVALALGLSASFWLPGVLELRHTAPVWPLDVRFSPRTELLDFAPGPFTQQRGTVQATYPRETLGLPVVVALAFALAALVVLRDRLDAGRRYHLWFGLLLSLGFILLMVAPFRREVWLALPFLERAQYGSRLILPVVVLGGLLAGGLIGWRQSGRVIGIVTGCIALAYGLAFAWPAATEHADDAYFRAHWQRWLGTSDGGSPIMPRWAQAGVYEPAREFVVSEPGVEVLSADKRSTLIDVHLRAERDALVRFSTLYFPGWQASVDGAPADIRIVPHEGTIAVPVAAGERAVSLRFHDTIERQIGEAITVLTAALLLVGAALPVMLRTLRRARPVRSPSTTSLASKVTGE